VGSYRPPIRGDDSIVDTPDGLSRNTCFRVCGYFVLFVCFLGCAFVGRDVVFVVWVVCDLVGWLSWEIGEAQGFSWFVSRLSAPAQCFFAPTQKNI
jgi:hypothetical protein